MSIRKSVAGPSASSGECSGAIAKPGAVGSPGKAGGAAGPGAAQDGHGGVGLSAGAGISAASRWGSGHQGTGPDGGRWLTVTDVRQYFYCPRIVYYRLCQPVRRPETYKMREGKLAQDREEGLERRRTFQVYGLEHGRRYFGQFLSSEAYGLRGAPDLVIATEDEAVIVEFKNTTRPPAPNHLYQLAAYALLVEEQWGIPVKRAFVSQIPLNKSVQIAVTAAARAAVVGALAAMRAMVASELLPEPTEHRARCTECEYLRYCGDIE